MLHHAPLFLYAQKSRHNNKSQEAKNMNTRDKIQRAKKNIWNAIDDYKAHTCQTQVLDDITDSFVDTLAEDNAYAKEGLRDLFRKSPVWNEKLDALIINGTRTHNPDYDRAYELAESILAPARMAADSPTNVKIARAIRFFTRPNATEEEKQEAIEAIQSLAPYAYAPNKKPSRIFKALCKALKISDETAGSNFQRQYAQFADEIASRKIPFKLFVSLNPAHFLTMSNPKEDERDDMLTSCHSFNDESSEYTCGCSGYARDEYTFIVFTATNPDVPETLNNRKNSRQIFAYKPGNGLLLQSRLYDANGGTCGAQEDSNLYRDLVQREIADLEGAVNLWKTYDYVGNSLCNIEAGTGFGGYEDWTYREFSAKISLREDHKEDFVPFTVGESGLCVCCGDEISKYLYCQRCKDNDEATCERCGESCDDTYPVYNEIGQRMYVCAECRSEHYTCCDECEDYHPDGEMTEVHGGGQVCKDCLEERYTRCHHCDEYYPDADVSDVDDHGKSVSVCDDCRLTHYVECEDCCEYYHEDDIKDGLCPSCHASAERDAA